MIEVHMKNGEMFNIENKQRYRKESIYNTKIKIPKHTTESLCNAMRKGDFIDINEYVFDCDEISYIKVTEKEEQDNE